MKEDFKRVSSCRLCSSQQLVEVLNFGRVPLANNLRTIEEAESNSVEFLAPLDVFRCTKCNSVQLKTEVNPEILFSNYNYESPRNLNPHFESYAKTTFNQLKLKSGDFIIGIGGNNGLLEKHYLNLGCKVLNVEPATNIANKSRENGVETYNGFFNKTVAEEILNSHGKAKLITSNNCFAHIPDLDEIVSGIKILLDEKGFFVFENAYLLKTLQNKDFGQFYHEHIFYHSITSLKTFFSKHGLDLFHVEFNDIQMGSFRCFVKHYKHNKIIDFNNDTIGDTIKNESIMGLNENYIFERFQSDIQEIRAELGKLLFSLKKDKKTVSLYGTPAKAVLLLKYFNIEEFISYAVDDSKLKQGKVVPGTKIQIKSSDYFKENPTDYCLIGAYNFAEDIVKNNFKYMGHWIKPLPFVEVK